jgi:hypothetical protein
MLQYEQYWSDHRLPNVITSCSNRVNPDATDISQSISISRPKQKNTVTENKIELEAPKDNCRETQAYEMILSYGMLCCVACTRE